MPAFLFVHNYVIQAKLWNRIRFPENPARFYTDCWIWIGPTVNGYGHFLHKDRHYLAHKVAYELATASQVAEGLVVRHKCPNKTDPQGSEEPDPRCCNPAHLMTGTVMDNIIDKIVARRCATGLKNGTYTHPEQRRKGEVHGMAKLKDDDVVLMRALYRDHNQYGLGAFMAQKFGMTVTNVMRVAKGNLWTHVALPDDFKIPPLVLLELEDYLVKSAASKSENLKEAKAKYIPPNAKLTEDDVYKIKRCREAGISLRALAIQFGVSTPVIANICNGKAWKRYQTLDA